MDLINIHRTFNPAPAQNIFLSAAYGTFSKIYHILRNKASPHNNKEIKIIPYILSNHREIKLQINSKGNHKTVSN